MFCPKWVHFNTRIYFTKLCREKAIIGKDSIQPFIGEEMLIEINVIDPSVVVVTVADKFLLSLGLTCSQLMIHLIQDNSHDYNLIGQLNQIKVSPRLAWSAAFSRTITRYLQQSTVYISSGKTKIQQ